MLALSSRSVGIGQKFPGDLIDRNFPDKEVGGVDMLEAATEDGKTFHIFCFKETDYMMKIMVSWMNLADMEGTNTKRIYKGRYGDPPVNIFKYWQPFGFHSR